ncbi:hypothetical protein BN946_scf184851.g33 [Trametes cinnabarina]|uniref:Deacetylase sirtuin-type domain-containing protein n=1 Tax=Pycnoporus cinnabarinus TaxID=5643 RepID=A0A060S5L7_PYCCI|nr:hypothetical protein BN946_scf184851.g33 [Trametes cinnabarina]
MQSSPPTPPTPPSRGSVPAGEPQPRAKRSAASKARSTLYAAQLRAFLEAAEMVDADPDVIEDLLDGFPVDSSDDDEDGNVDVEEEEENTGAAPAVDAERERERDGHERLRPEASGRVYGGAEDAESDDDEEGVSAEWEACLQEGMYLVDSRRLSDGRDTMVCSCMLRATERADAQSVKEWLWSMTAWTKQEVKEMMLTLKEKGTAAFMTEYVVRRAVPIPKLLYAFGVCLCPELRTKQPRTLMYLLRVALSRELESRERLSQYNTIDDVVRLIQASSRILILTGAGISVSCGIPDFRSRNGLYASLQENGEYDLDDPQQMFDIEYFRENPAVPKTNLGVDANAHDICSSFASKIYPSNFIPSPCHRFIKLIEDKGKLLRNYTQNIDTLETLAGVKRVVQCHGSFATASCINCRARVPGAEIADDIMNQRVPICKACNVAPPPAVSAKPGKKGKKRKEGWDSDASDEPEPPSYPPGIMKASGCKKLDDAFERSLMEDRHQVDLLIIIGTSLKVSPVSETISKILINKTPIRHINPDVVLLGDADDIVKHLCRKLGWDLPDLPTPDRSLDAPKVNLKKRPSADFEREPKRVGDSHVWLFEGAEGGKWVEEIERQYQQRAQAVDVSSSAPSGRPEVPEARNAKKARTE